MRVFSCGNCGEAVYFENIVCGNCGSSLGFDPQIQSMHALFPDDSGRLTTRSAGGNAKTYCANYNHQICNWLIPEDSHGKLCMSCGMNRTIPNLDIPSNVEHWFEIEKAKRRLIYDLLKLGLPVEQAGAKYKVPPLAFDILLEAKTGHKNGLITLDLAEANAAIREQTREHFNEPYRTVLGHLRHESGHYYWLALVNNDDWLPRFRQLFGDESPDYGEALDAYHQSGPKADWAQNYISAYATAHPWEDWAESWAHYLHMVEALETAANYKIEPVPPYSRKRNSWFTRLSDDPYKASNAKELIDRWIPLALAINSLNRSMGLSDFYPFVISPSTAEKLEFIHQVIRSAASDRM